MKRILGFLFLAFALAFMLNACSSGNDSVKPVFRELFDTYNVGDKFPIPAGENLWSNYIRTAGDTWIPDNWSIGYNGADDAAQLSVPAVYPTVQNSAFITSGYNTTDVDSSVSARMNVSSGDPTLIGNYSVQAGVILRASVTPGSHAHYAFLYNGLSASIVYDTVTFTALNPVAPGAIAPTITLVFNGTTDTLSSVVTAWNLLYPANTVGFTGQPGSYPPKAGTAILAYGAPTVAIQKVDATGNITTLLSAIFSNYANVFFDPTLPHTYRFLVSGTNTLTFTASIDGVQLLPAVYNPDGSIITPANPPITDSVGVYHSGEPGFFVANANTAWVTRFFMWQP